MQNAIGALNKLGVKVTKGMITGEQLTSAGRQYFVSQAKQIYDRRERAYTDAVENVQEAARAFVPRVDPNFIIKPIYAGVGQTAGGGATEGGGADNNPLGI